jgi:hypothetical protein
MDILRHEGRAQLSSLLGGAFRNADAQVWSVAPYTEADLTRQVEMLPRLLSFRGELLKSDMAGYLVFSWNYQSSDKSCAGTSLDLHPDNLAVLQSENARAFDAGQARPIPQGGLSRAQLTVALLVVVLVGGVVILVVAARRQAR